MSRIIYVGASNTRLKVVAKSLTLVPPLIGGTLAVKWSKVAALTPWVKVRPPNAPIAWSNMLDQGSKSFTVFII